MALHPKLEFYRFTLSHKKGDFKTFRDFLIEELNTNKNIPLDKVIEACHKHFVQSLKSDFAKDDKLKKKICIENKKTINKYLENKPNYNSAESSISGVINGGFYGRDRIVSNNDDEDDSMTLGSNKSVLQYYFFYLYLPYDHNEGFFMIHSNSKEESITNIFRNYIAHLFRGHNYNKPVMLDYCPKSFQDEFKNGAILKSMSFKTSFVDDMHSIEAISSLNQQYDIKIIATPKNKNYSSSNIREFLNILQTKIFGSVTNGKPLNEFEETKITMESDITKAKKTFEWHKKDNEFIPVVYLEGRVEKTNPDGTPEFSELKEYCKRIFIDEILPEIRPDLNVTKAK